MEYVLWMFIIIIFPDISNWNINNITYIYGIFNGCLSLPSMPDISKWNSNIVTHISGMFEDCPNIVFSKKNKIKFINYKN